MKSALTTTYGPVTISSRSNEAEKMDRPLNPPDLTPADRTTYFVLDAVAIERERQNRLVADGRLPWNCADREVEHGDKLFVITEELGEVAKAAYEIRHEQPHPKMMPDDAVRYERAQIAHLREELIELAACAVAWAESLPNS